MEGDITTTEKQRNGEPTPKSGNGGGEIHVWLRYEGNDGEVWAKEKVGYYNVSEMDNLALEWLKNLRLERGLKVGKRTWHDGVLINSSRMITFEGGILYISIE